LRRVENAIDIIACAPCVSEGMGVERNKKDPYWSRHNTKRVEDLLRER
jgi:hypothetical protein